eukprot:403335288
MAANYDQQSNQDHSYSQPVNQNGFFDTFSQPTNENSLPSYGTQPNYSQNNYSQNNNQSSNFINKILNQNVDLLRRREEFAVSLRKKNKNQKISELRRKIDTKSKQELLTKSKLQANNRSGQQNSSTQSSTPPSSQSNEAFSVHPAFNDFSKSPEEKIGLGLSILASSSDNMDDTQLYQILRQMRIITCESDISQSAYLPGYLTQDDCAGLSKLMDILVLKTEDVRIMREASWLIINVFLMGPEVNQFIDNKALVVLKMSESMLKVNQQLQKFNEDVKDTSLDSSQQQQSLNQIYQFQKIFNQLMWGLANFIQNSQLLTEVAIDHSQMFDILAVYIYNQGDMQAAMFEQLCTICKDVSLIYKDEWHPRFVNFMSVLSQYAHNIFTIEFMSKDQNLNILRLFVRYTEKDERAIELFMDNIDITDYLVQALKQDNYDMVWVSVRILGNLLSSSETSYTKLLLEHDLVSAMAIAWTNLTKTLGQSSFKNSRIGNSVAPLDEDFCWIYSNLAAANDQELCYKIISDPMNAAPDFDPIDNVSGQVCTGVMRHIRRNLRSNNFKHVQESLHIIKNLVLSCEIQFIEQLVKVHDLLDDIRSILQYHIDNNDPNTSLLSLSMAILIAIFQKERILYCKEFYLEFERQGGVDLIEILQENPNATVYNQCVEILQTYGDADVLGEINNDQQQQQFREQQQHSNNASNNSNSNNNNSAVNSMFQI